MRVLIVDDTARARQSMKALLVVWHKPEEIREAASGPEAVKLVEEFQPDIILMDARMPVMSGLEATRVIKANWPQIKIILLSVFTDYQALAMEAGADGFVSKSDSPETLRKLLEEVLQKSATDKNQTCCS
jgi:YesN/AraC family two-component response regulator